MNRFDFQEIAELRLRESKALLAAGHAEGAYYLAGYAVECALKACIAKRTQRHDFPEKKLVNESHTHNLKELVRLATLDGILDADSRKLPVLATNWTIIQNWSEASRYEHGRAQQEAVDLLQAIEDSSGGLLPWLQLRW
jgi:hypothetical protein